MCFLLVIPSLDTKLSNKNNLQSILKFKRRRNKHLNTSSQALGNYLGNIDLKSNNMTLLALNSRIKHPDFDTFPITHILEKF